MCAQMNNLDEIRMDSQEMKDLDDLLESIEDHDEYYAEIFDTIMYE